MELLTNYKRELLWSFVVFLLFVASGITYNSFVTHEQLANFKKQTIDDRNILIQTVIYSLNKRSDALFNLKINCSDVTQIMHDANDPTKRDNARKQLYTLLQPTYNLMVESGIRQLHFHLPNNISFLRFHKPQKYGDSLQGIRYSIDRVNKTKTVVRGFEEGRIFNGFRNVYPIFHNKIFVGTVEISFSIRAIAQTLLSQDQDSYYALLISKDIVAQKVWRENQKYYLSSKINNHYLWDKKALFSLYNTPKQREVFHNVEYAISHQFNTLSIVKENFLIPFTVDSHHYIAIFKSTYNIQNKPIGYIVTILQNDFIASLTTHEYIGNTLILLAGMLIAFLVFRFLKQDHDNIEFFKQKSYYDPLTQLLNRRGFETIYKTTLHHPHIKKQHFTLFFMDIDYFKKINDQHGHDKGDAVLQKLAQTLKSNLRESDIIARWGGEEFVVLLHNTPTKTAGEIAEKLRKEIEQISADSLPKFTISIGIAYGHTNQKFENILKKADIALYEAKASGRNRVVVHEHQMNA